MQTDAHGCSMPLFHATAVRPALGCRAVIATGYACCRHATRVPLRLSAGWQNRRASKRHVARSVLHQLTSTLTSQDCPLQSLLLWALHGVRRVSAGENHADIILTPRHWRSVVPLAARPPAGLQCHPPSRGAARTWRSPQPPWHWPPPRGAAAHAICDHEQVHPCVDPQTIIMGGPDTSSVGLCGHVHASHTSRVHSANASSPSRTCGRIH